MQIQSNHVQKYKKDTLWKLTIIMTIFWTIGLGALAVYSKANLSYVSSEQTKQKTASTKPSKTASKRWQYMICSDGSARQYTDEQLKDPSVGFTEDSEDYCKQNGQGEKISLSDTPPKTNASPVLKYSANSSQSVSSSPTASQVNKPKCEIRQDIPYKTVEKPNSNLNVGQTKVGFAGYLGSHSICTDLQGNVTSDSVVSEPIDRIVYYGTFTYEQAMSKAQSLCVGQPLYSTFYGDCIDREMSNQGW